jgi:polysaccharide export outer membrane protein
MAVFCHSRLALAAALVCVSVSGCATSPDLYRGGAAYDLMQTTAKTVEQTEYHINPLDILRVNVLYEADLSDPAVHVGQNGEITLPLAGSMQAAGKTTTELAAEISTRLGAQYLRHPSVTVAVETSSTQKVVVEGDVAMPGAYDVSGSAGLLEALARAQSPTRVASLHEVVVFRQVDGKRVGAVFDATRIRAGLDPDPHILGGDVVVVGFSYVKGAYRDMIEALPSIAAFRLYH